MRTYEHFARYYDALMGDPLENASRVRGYIARHMPAARSLLELGCGSGSILAELTSLGSLTGIDRSPQMLAAARAKVPQARLIEMDMRSFELGEHFDVVICVFDTLNHLDRFEDWRHVFRRTAAHLNDRGLFAFDVNTTGALRRLGADPPWQREVPGATITQYVEPIAGHESIWHVVMRERQGGRSVLHHERIRELGVELAAVEDALDADFTLLERADDDGAPPTDESARAYFLYRRRPRGSITPGAAGRTGCSGEPRRRARESEAGR